MSETVDYWGLAGFFLIVEGVLSIIGSQDQKSISQVGRLARIGVVLIAK